MFERSGILRGGASEDNARQRRERQKLVVHTRKGEIYFGICFALNKNASGFHLDLQDRNGRTLDRTKHVLFNTITGVHYVRSYDGRFNPEEAEEVVTPRHSPVAITFIDDEEVLCGRPMHATWRDEPRFFLVPEGHDKNTMMVLVERSAIKTVQDLNEYKRKRNAEFSEFARRHRKPGMSAEECMGDFYFSKHDYKNALRHYRNAKDQAEITDSLKKKLCAAKYNLAMKHIKHKDYARALQLMEMILKIDPDHEKALHKEKQLRDHFEKKRSGTGFGSDSGSNPSFP